MVGLSGTVGKGGVAGDGRVAFDLIEIDEITILVFFLLKIMLINTCTSCTCTRVVKSEHNQEPQWIGII